jgi:hypothetical protein
VEQTGHSMVADGETVANSGVAESTSDERFSTAGGAEHQDVVTAGDPVALAEFQDGVTVEAAGRGEVDIFQAGLHGEVGGVDVPSDAVLATLAALVIHEQDQAIFEGEFGVFGISLLFAQGIPESGQTQFKQLVIESLWGHQAPLLVIIIATHICVDGQGWLGGIGSRQAFKF